MKRPFMAAQRLSVSSGAWPRGPVVRVSVKQTYLPKGRAAGGSGAGAGAGRGSPQCPGLWQGHKAPTSGFSGQSGGVTGCAHTSPCPPTVFHPYVSPLPAFHTYPSGSQPPRLPSCQPRCLARLSHLPPSSDGACSGEPPGEVLLFPAPHKGRFGGQSCLPVTPAHCTARRQADGDRKTAAPSPWQLYLLGGRAGDLSSGRGSGPCVCALGMPTWAGREPGAPMSSCSPDQPCGVGRLL